MWSSPKIPSAISVLPPYSALLKSCSASLVNGTRGTFSHFIRERFGGSYCIESNSLRVLSTHSYTSGSSVVVITISADHREIVSSGEWNGELKALTSVILSTFCLYEHISTGAHNNGIVWKEARNWKSEVLLRGRSQLKFWNLPVRKEEGFNGRSHI